jgi:ankyrin repeat protein
MGSKGGINMTCRLYLCLLVAGVFILAAGRAAKANPLIEAASMGDTEKVQTLLAQGADVNAKDSRGCTALMWAKREGHKEIVRILKEAGAKE